jgi:hypothetical protein
MAEHDHKVAPMAEQAEFLSTGHLGVSKQFACNHRVLR